MINLITIPTYSFAALAVLLDFLLQVTAFVALIVFDFLRAEDRRIDCFPCIKMSSSSADLDKGICKHFPIDLLWCTDLNNCITLAPQNSC